MDNALSLLKTAIADNDIQDRTERVIKACKLITDFLPFAGEGKAIILEPELVKYLMLSVPFNARSIEWLIFSMFDKFKYNKQFLKQLWIGFSAIAFLSDKDGNDPKKENTGLRKFQTEMRKVLSLSKSSVSDDGVFESQIFKNQDFCDIIKENKEVIKLSCLKQIKRFLGVYYKELVSALNFKPDFAELLKKFLLHTSNGKIIIKTVKVIEKLRQEDPFSCDIEIEDILISKQNCIFDTPPPLQQITETAQQKPWGRANTIKPNQRTKSVLTRMNTLHDSNILNSINSRPILKKAASLLIDEAELKPKESKEASAVLKENDELRKLEEWLSGDEIGQPALMNNRADLKTYIYNFENFEYLLSFIFDPEAQPLALCWEENYSSILNAISEEDDKASDISQYSTPPKLNKADDDLKYSKLYVLRSFKTAQALGDERNFNQIFDQNKEALESYFYNIYNTLSIRKDTSCNHHHIGLLTESLVRRESDLCVGFILYYNLLYNFIQKIEVPHFQKLLLTLFKASENAKDMQFEAYAKLLRYCQSSSFFSDISLAILRGWNSFQASKFNVDYKPPGVEDLVSLAMERSEPRMLTDKSIVQSTVDLKDSFLTQELLNFQVDIDNLQAVLEKDTQIDREALLQTTQMSTPKKLKQKKYSNYPSLAELESERGTLLGSIDLSETRRGSIDNGDHNLLNTQSGKSLANMHLSHRKNAHSKVSVESQKLKGTLTPSINNSSSKKENRNVTLDPGFKDTKSGIAKKLDFDSTKPSAVKQPEGILKKVGKYTVSSLDAIPDELQTKEKPVKSLNYLGVIRRKPGTKKGFIRPIKNTVSMDLDKEAIDHEKIAELDKLYPTSARAKTSIELEASGEEYNVSNLLENDHFSLALCEFLEVLFRNALLSKPFDVDEMEKRLESGLGTYLFNQQNLNQMKQKYENKRNIGVSELDFFAFWQAVFSSNCALFENLLKNYLFKIKLHHIQENNSGYAAGVLVNLILEECVKGNPYFEPYLEQIRSICKKHMPMLCKTIVQSHAWKQRDGDKVYLQDFQVKHPLGAGRIQLVQTLKLFIENDFEQKYQICNRITDTCWHVLMIWLANNKTNNMYHQIFYTIFEITFLHSEESLLTDILVKLGFIANMYKVWSDIFQNNMLRKDNHIESILYHLRKLVYLIEFVAQRNEDYKILKRELKRSLSWEIVKSGLLPDKENPKSESRPGSENRQTFSNSFNSRMRKNGRVLDELTASKIENKSRQRLDSETSFEFPEGSANREGRISSIEKFVY